MSNIYLELEKEFDILNQKTSKLNLFLKTDKFKKLSENSQSLLFIQHEAMRTYGSCLVSRMKLIMEEAINE